MNTRRGGTTKTRRARPQRSWWKRWFSHRNLIAAEVLLLMDLILRVLKGYLITAEIPDWLKILILMAAVVGLFGGLLLVVERLTEKSIELTYDIIRGLPLPTPIVFLHIGVLVAIYWLYALVLGLHPIPQQDATTLSLAIVWP